MSRYNRTPTVTGLWFKYVLEILKDAKRPLSTYALLFRFKSKMATQGLCKPGSSSLLSCPDVSYLDWMASKNKITKHKFKNRKSDYYSYGLNVTYDFMNDSEEEDQVAIPSHLQPSGKSHSDQISESLPNFSIDKEIKGKSLILDTIDERKPFNDGDFNKLLSAVDALTNSMVILNKIVEDQGKEIETLKHAISELEIKEGIDRTKPKSGSPKTAKKPTPKKAAKIGMIASDYAAGQHNKLRSIKNMRDRTQCGLKEAIDAYDLYTRMLMGVKS